MEMSNTVGLLVFTLAITFGGARDLHAKEPFFDGLGSYSRKITTDSPQAQRYFNQGLAFYHGFNHGEAIRSFQEAARLDPKCAMAHWGIALACGPHINLPLVPPPAAELAWKELKLAQENAEHASPVERDLIEALSHRYANPQPEDRAPLDQAYADAMRKVWQNYPNDPGCRRAFRRSDDGSASVESMDARRSGKSRHRRNSRDARRGLEAESETSVRESSLHSRDRSFAASGARERGGGSSAHLAARSRAQRAHAVAHRHSLRPLAEGGRHERQGGRGRPRYRKIVGPPKGFINVYVAHNRHMLAYAAMMTGQRELAMKHIRAMVAELPADFLKENALQAEGFVAMPLEVMVRFGMWDEILAEPDNYADYMTARAPFITPPAPSPMRPKAIPKTRAKNRRSSSRKRSWCRKRKSWATTPRRTCSRVAQHMIEGEILIRENKLDAGIAELREAIKLRGRAANTTNRRAG